MIRIFLITFLMMISTARAHDSTWILTCANLHDHSSELSLSKDRTSAQLTIFVQQIPQTFHMDCTELDSESLAIGCQDAGMPSIYQAMISKNFDRAFLYEYGDESSIKMSDLHCEKK